MPKKLIIIGLDCAAPGLVFEKYTDRLPNIRRLMRQGSHARLRSTDPPITVPAWTAMTTGKDPGTLGIYGFRNRRDHRYDSLAFADATWVKEPRIWDILGQQDKKCIMIGIPQTYPPAPVNGIMVSGFLAPSMEHAFVYPDSFKAKIDGIAPDYMLDVADFRTGDKEQIRDQVYRMTAERFKLVRHCIREEAWDFLMVVEIGLDRLQHAFWAYMDSESPFFQKDHPFAAVIPDYYRYLDQEIGNILDMTDPETCILIVSDHGAKAFHGGFCVNEWLIREGYLNVQTYPDSPAPLRPENIVWPQTRAWAEGGYYARVNLNLQGREPQGIVRRSEQEDLIGELKKGLQTVAEGSHEIENQVYRPAELYAQIRNIPPDLMVYPDNLNYRSIGGIGYDRIFIEENDGGADHANHDFYGIFIASEPDVRQLGSDEISIYDIAPMVLDYMRKG